MMCKIVNSKNITRTRYLTKSHFLITAYGWASTAVKCKQWATASYYVNDCYFVII